MTDLMHLVSDNPPYAKARSEGLRLAPFFNAVLVYFIFVQDPHGELWTTLLKCAPIVFLMMYILLKGFAFTSEYKSSQRVLAGLVFSCAGDVLLNIDLFPHGMGAFAVAQIFYISAFGWRPIKWAIGIPLYVAVAITVGVIFKSLEGVLVFGLPLYATLLVTMCWRSIARAMDKQSFIYVFCAIGSVLFVISDGLIGVDMFLIKVPNARIWIMITYYVAQLAIALSTSNESKSSKPHAKMSKSNRRSTNNSATRRHKLNN